MSEPLDDEESERLAQGTVLGERYRIEGALGDGGIGWVYRAEDLELGRMVAVKTLQPQYADHAPMRSRFEREAKALASLDHPHIVSLLGFSIADGRPYLVMELLEGHTLAARLEDGPLEEEIVRDIARQTLDALAYAHAQGCVHRDLKPANIFLCERPTSPHHVKILDFGFVKLVAGDDVGTQSVLTRSGVAFGTPGYMSPEQAVGGVTDARSDLYSLTVVLFHMLAGRRPFVGSLPEVVRQHLTEPVPDLSVGGRALCASIGLRELLHRGMAKEPGDRFQSAEEMRDALLALPAPLTRPAALGEAPTMPALSLAAHEPTRPQRPVARSGSSSGARPRGAATSSGSPETDASGDPDETDDGLAAPPAARRRLGRAAVVVGVGLVAAVGVWLGAGRAEEELERLGAAPRELRADDTAAAARTGPAPDERVEPREGPTPGHDVAREAPTADPTEDADEDRAPAVDGDDADGDDADGDDADGDDADGDDADGDDASLEARDDGPSRSDEPPPGEDADGEGEPFGPSPWETRPPSPQLARARRQVLAGRPLTPDEDRGLRVLARADRGDPRPHLVLAQSFVAAGQAGPALARYELAHRVDDSARADPRMLSDLVRLATESEARERAARVLERVYGEEGLEHVRGLLEDAALEPARRGALVALRDRLERGPDEPSAAQAPARRAARAGRARRPGARDGRASRGGRGAARRGHRGATRRRHGR
ncbi:MAG: protein kinase [Sandaracinaceae bacterium]|nr:protein kinase [Sandaracinaceae bacterium]